MASQPLRHKILIADDSEMNRAILADMLGTEYDILEAGDGLEALDILEQRWEELSLVLLDIVMPGADGFQVLDVMNRNHWIEDVPVIIISADARPNQVERAYALGATDFISRPFDALIVHKRVVNTILLYSKQKRLMDLVARQVYESELQRNMMIDILSHIVEFRNGESGLHIQHVRILTELFLQRFDRMGVCRFSKKEISMIGLASGLHDIGKIAIPEAILNKPGRLTAEEFTVIKSHTVLGAKALEDIAIYQDQPLVRTARDICRWHHERWDGGGYPDGLKGDEIPLTAQVVALADVYDALTSVRVYKGPYPHEEAIQMILNGECGAFSPLLMNCLREMADDIPAALREVEQAHSLDRELADVTQELLRGEDLSVSRRTLQLMEQERSRNELFASLNDEIQFEFTMNPLQLTLSPFGAQKLELPRVIQDPLYDPRILALCGARTVFGLSGLLRSTSPGKPTVSYDCLVKVGKERRWHRIVAQALWSSDEPPRYTGAVGKATDIHEARLQMDALEWQASSDPLTGLLNHQSAKKQITARLEERPKGHFALALIDLDLFKVANDTYGHLFGDELLKHLAGELRKKTRGGDIVARVGGDEFLIFMEYKNALEPIIHRIFHSLQGKYGEFEISLSMGVARTGPVEADYDALFRAADSALYSIKKGQRGKGGRYVFYDPSMPQMTSAISPMEEEKQSSNEEGGSPS